MPASPIDTWIRDCLSQEELRARSVIATVFGDAVAPRGGRIWLKSLAELLAPFGINERLVRTGVFRLAAEGWLEAERHGRLSAYRLTDSGARRFDGASRRIYAPPRTAWPDHWTLVLFSPAELEASQRAALRHELQWLGFVPAAPGVLAHPAAEPRVLAEVLERLGLAPAVMVLQARDLALSGVPGLADRLREAWTLAPVAEAYRRFIARFERVQKLLPSGHSPEPGQAFVMRTLLVHQFRRALLDDPQLPPALLDADWPGEAAYALCASLYRRLHAPAEAHLAERLRGDDGHPAPPLSDAFFERFGGLPRS
ncbi:phenylacetic acid degradation operon negative regulatory protein PaaX [Caldimonas tepidiphila]|uniref:phenylacetic acid degradation operon negative regulatory protein PaaX n=1 Tax=Caldimonas tepidiphila TaxID=2315841 RepID=UPI001300BEDE|nr:phenylacetic acid degradation operon negative regulatory protein PaaX [Caldimonas tepidiphila]